MTDFTRKYGAGAIGGRLRRLSESVDEDARRIYAELGLKFEQRWLGVMEQIAEHGPQSVSDLARALGISHPSVSETRRSLEGAGLIESKSDPDDARSRVLALSKHGRELYLRLSPLWALLNQTAIELNKEAGDVMASLDRLDEALERQSLYDRIKMNMARSSMVVQADSKRTTSNKSRRTQNGKRSSR